MKETFGLIGAMVEEVNMILDEMIHKQPINKAGLTFTKGVYRGVQVVVVKSGVGKVNAAVCTQILIDQFSVDKILFTGVAGALNPELEVGDIVVSEDCMHHDMDVSALGFPRGTIPFDAISLYPSDPELSQIAFDSSYALFPGRTYRGRVLSGDQFIADRKTVSQLYEELNGYCTEMEGAAVAQVCTMNDVPHVIIRSMSDKADGSAPDNFQQFMITAAENSCRIVERILDRVSVQN